MPNTTTKYALRSPLGTEAADGPTGIKNLADDVDGKMAGYAEGTLAAIPAAGKNGRIYRATDTTGIFLDTGSAWVDIGGIKPMARVRHSAVQSAAQAGSTLAWNTEDYDTNAIHDPVTNNSRLTCKTAGVYRIFFHPIVDSANINDSCTFQLKTGGVVIAESQHSTRIATAQGLPPLVTDYLLAVNDFVEVVMFSNQANLTDLVPGVATAFGMTLISRAV